MSSVLVTAAPAQADAPSCTGTHTGETFPNGLTVPTGQQCFVEFGTIAGTATAQAGSLLTIAASHVTGNVTTDGGAVQLRAVDSDLVVVDGDVVLQHTHEFSVSNAFAIQVVVCGVNVNGALTITGAAGRGPVVVGAAPCPAPLANHVGSSFVFQNNIVSGGFQNMISNTAVANALLCSGNQPPPTGAANTARVKSGQCAAL